jgi:hypothetical protein
MGLWMKFLTHTSSVFVSRKLLFLQMLSPVYSIHSNPWQSVSLAAVVQPLNGFPIMSRTSRFNSSAVERCKYIFSKGIVCDWSQGSVTGIVTHYGLDGREIESQWEQDFQHRSRPATGPTQPPLKWILDLFPGVRQPGHSIDNSPSSSTEVKKRVDLCL